MNAIKHLLLFLVLSLLAGCKLATIRPLDPETGKAIIGTEEQAFNAERYVAARWDDPMLTTMKREAVTITDLLAALEEDSNAASEHYGHQQGNSPYSFMVKGEGRVLEHDSSSRAGLLRLDLEPFDDQADISLAVGPVIRGTALRDAMPFINFNDFTNQLEFADVSKALHARVMREVLEPFDITASIGKNVQFLGTSVFGDAIVITPVSIEVSD